MLPNRRKGVSSMKMHCRGVSSTKEYRTPEAVEVVCLTSSALRFPHRRSRARGPTGVVLLITKLFAVRVISPARGTNKHHTNKTHTTRTGNNKKKTRQKTIMDGRWQWSSATAHRDSKKNKQRPRVKQTNQSNRPTVDLIITDRPNPLACGAGTSRQSIKNHQRMESTGGSLCTS